MKTLAIIGLGFGDEGKGGVVNHLCSNLPQDKTLVVRFSGGQQAGHTVIHNNIRHVFSNFGSGTLLNIPTYWSAFCTIDPVGIKKEYENLKVKQQNPILYIDKLAMVTTPYDKYHQQKNEKYCSCGTGFGTTIERELKQYSLKYEDLFNPTIFKIKLKMIGKYYNLNILLDNFLEACDFLLNNFKPCSYNTIELFENIVFEGSQGLLLDKHIGFKPYISWTDTKPAMARFHSLKHNLDEIYFVTRAYQTRHGKGPMTNENIPHNILENPNETNVTNKFQGKLRRSLLDLDLLSYSLNNITMMKDEKKILVITCLEHIVNEYRFTYNNKIICCDNENDFVEKVSKYLNIKNIIKVKNHEFS